MKTTVKIALVAASLLGAATSALSDPPLEGRRGGGGGGTSRPASSRGSVRNSTPAGADSRPAEQPAARAETPEARPNAGARETGNAAEGRSVAVASRPAAGTYCGSRTVPAGTMVGKSVAALPAGNRPVTVAGTSYHYAGGVFYAQGAGGYAVVRAPVGAVVGRPLPGGTWRYWWGRRWYWYYGGAYYCDHDCVESDTDDEPEEAPAEPEQYEVVEPTIGVILPYLPEGAKAVEVGGKNYFEYEGTYYKPTLKDGEVAYLVVAPPA